MRSGTLRHRIAIQGETSIPDGMGGFTTTWAAITGMASVPAAIWPLSAKESLDAMKLELTVTHKIRIRYRSGITAANRILFGSRTFNIISMINPDEKNKMIDFLAIEET